jgi:hypothetical protein
MKDAIAGEAAVAVCAIRPIDRAALAALCRLDQRLAIRCSTADTAELVRRHLPRRFAFLAQRRQNRSSPVSNGL